MELGSMTAEMFGTNWSGIVLSRRLESRHNFYYELFPPANLTLDCYFVRYENRKKSVCESDIQLK